MLYDTPTSKYALKPGGLQFSGGSWRLFITLLWLWTALSGFAQTPNNKSLNGTWSFQIDPYSRGEAQGWHLENLSTSSWDSMPVPGNWDLKNEYADYAGDAWYSRTFTVERNRGQQVRLVFESVYNDAKVWINGQAVGENHLGFLPFHIDITKYVKPGKPNRLTVRVNNVFKRGALWNWGGIRRPVWLEITPSTRLEFQHIDAVPDLQSGEARISTKISCSNSSGVPKEVTVGIRIKRENKLVAEAMIPTTIPANTSSHVVAWAHQLPKALVALWHFDFPELYTSEITLYHDKEVLHTLHDRFGIRKLEVDGTTLLLNGEAIRPVGFNLVPEDRFTGNTLPLARIKEDVDLMKSLGANMARLSHVSLPKAFLDYLDEKGIMVMEEVGLWGKDAWVDPNHPVPQEWLQRIIAEKYNHPAVVGWSVGNEIGDESKNPKVREYVKGAIQMAKQLDPNRLAVYVSNTAQRNPDDAIVYSDLAMINLYGGWGAGIDRAWGYHQKPIFVSEFGNVLNSEDPNLGSIPIEKMMDAMRQKAYVLGASLWTLNDYRSNYYGGPGWNTPPSQNRPWGIVTTFRTKKRAYHEVQHEFAPIRNMSIQDADQQRGTASVTITPREKLDIPANILRGYSLRWQVIDEHFNPVETQTQKLPLINPGDTSLVEQIHWNSQSVITQLNVELVDPQGYSVWQETHSFKVPGQPIITFVNTSNNTIRLYFEKSPDVPEHLVRYYRADTVFTTEKTINAFIDITNDQVKQGSPWMYQLIAVNSAGESPPSGDRVLTKDEDELPPIVWESKRVEDDIYIAYSVAPDDYLYELEYGAQPMVYTHRYTSKLKGVLHLQSIEPGKPLFFRMRVRKQWGFASEWTKEYEVK